MPLRALSVKLRLMDMLHYFNEESFIDVLLHADLRAKLYVALEADKGPAWALLSVVATKCRASAGQLQTAISALEADGSPTAESVARELLFHPGFDDETLLRLAQNPAYTTPLGHRSGPRELLEFLAERYAYPEAVTTLALNYYGAPEARAKPFAEFLERYKGIEMLEYNLLNARNLDPAKAAIVARVFSGV